MRVSRPAASSAAAHAASRHRAASVTLSTVREARVRQVLEVRKREREEQQVDRRPRTVA